MTECWEGATVPEPAMAMRVGVGRPPKQPGKVEVADGFEPVSRFLLKVSDCGGLPWEYSNFAAGNTFTPPTDEDYRGPTFFVTSYWCEDEVPANERSTGGEPATARPSHDDLRIENADSGEPPADLG